MKFGVAHGNAPASRSLEILRAAEDAGFDQFWMYDSHVIWQDCYSVLGWLIGLSRSETMEFGTLVTNPVSRDPTVTASAATMNPVRWSKRYDATPMLATAPMPHASMNVVSPRNHRQPRSRLSR